MVFQLKNSFLKSSRPVLFRNGFLHVGVTSLGVFVFLVMYAWVYLAGVNDGVVFPALLSCVKAARTVLVFYTAPCGRWPEHQLGRQTHLGACAPSSTAKSRGPVVGLPEPQFTYL